MNQLKVSYFQERLAAWKVCLPIIPKLPILATGLEGISLLSLARSWDSVHVHQCEKRVFEWVKEQVKELDLGTEFKIVDEEELYCSEYHAIAIGSEGGILNDPRRVRQLLKPGGSVVWIGPRNSVPNLRLLNKEGYDSIRRYAVLPPNTCKVIIPTSKGTSACSGLKFYTPGKWHNRLAVKCFHMMSKCGLQGGLGVKQIVVAKKPGSLPKDAYLVDWLSDLLGHRVADMAIYPGSNQAPGQRKITLQVLDDNGRALAIVKIADTTPAKRAIEKESVILKRLQQFDDLRYSVPKVIASENWHDHAVQIQEFVGFNKNKYATRVTPAHLKFLEALGKIDQHEMTLEDWPLWSQMLRKAQEGKFGLPREASKIREALDYCAKRLGSNKLLFHRIHGDFTPWNVFKREDKVIVVDWEDSEQHGLPLYDLIHFVFRERTLIEKWRPSITELFSATPRTFGIEPYLASLSRSIPKFSHTPGCQREDLMQCLLILSLAFETMESSVAK